LEIKMTTILDALGPDPRACRVVNGRKKQLAPDEVIAIVTLVQLGHRQIDVAARFGVSDSAISAIMSGHRWSDVTGIRPTSEKATGRHAVALIDELAKRPDDAPRLREMFDAKFGDGAALRSVKQLLTAGAR
jgi:predicted transcriptional regulator